MVPCGHEGISDRYDMIRCSYGTYNVMGENVACHWDTEEEAFDAWLSSPGHLANIENPNYTHMGYGRVGNNHTVLFKGYLAEVGP